MKAVTAMLLATLSLSGCKQNTQRPTTISYDRWWSSDYAANAAELSCSASAQGFSTQVCESEDSARADEADFFGKFSAAFQSDPTCSGLRLMAYNGNGNNSKDFYREYSKAVDNGYWNLIVSFAPDAEKQSWTLTMQSKGNDSSVSGASGEGTAQSISHAICSIAKKTGGAVTDY